MDYIASMNHNATFAIEGSLQVFKQDFEDQGFAIVRDLLSSTEVKEIKDEFMKIHSEGGVPKLFEPLSKEKSNGDPLKEYPRVMHPHKFNSLAMRYMLHPEIRKHLEILFSEEPLAAQSMFYFKPPGARGQALHQDNFYLMVSPGTCIAAWTAIDDCDVENGAMYIVPGSHRTEIVCPETADEKESFTTHFVPVPKGMKAELAEMKAGDTLFFNGTLIHGSGPNRSKHRFRRAFIAHFTAKTSDKISEFYLPLHRMDGSPVMIPKNESGGACGEAWKGAVHG